ncbi:LCP family protein [Streptomyces sp. BI20]|uniref:LCP family protein n=1 Tax=Streptomyces sp. BI20 TaxID=3403460 RepID=UPI003C765FB9
MTDSAPDALPDGAPTTVPTSPADGGGSGRRRAKPPRRARRALRIALLVFALLVAGSAAGVWWVWQDLSSNLSSVDLDKAIGDNRPPKVAANARNVLVLGSDSRGGANGELDTAGATTVSGARSDTAMLVHLPASGGKATAVSIPRDTLVERPACPDRDGGELPPAHRVMFNSLYSDGGSACVVKTVETMSGIRVDHLLEVDFAGFKELVDALGGVTVTLDKPMSGAKGSLKLDAGTHRLDGTQALRFVRTRYGYGDGSDLGRIGLQQTFLMAVLAEVRKQDALGDPARLYKLADAGTKALTTDSGLSSLPALAEFARSLQGVDPARMETLTLPVAADRIDPNRVVPEQDRADALWQALRDDVPVPAALKKQP